MSGAGSVGLACASPAGCRRAGARGGLESHATVDACCARCACTAQGALDQADRVCAAGGNAASTQGAAMGAPGAAGSGGGGGGWSGDEILTAAVMAALEW